MDSSRAWQGHGGRQAQRAPRLRRRVACALIVLAMLALACETAPTSEPATANPDGGVTLTGWFNIVFGPEPRFILDTEPGDSYELLIDESYLTARGGALAFNRQRVAVTGVLLRGAPRRLQVTALDLA